MSALDDILRQLPINDLAAQLGTDPATVERAAGPAITSLLGGLHDNAQQPEGEQQLAQVLDTHAQSPLATDGQLSLDQVDANEGEKIVGHVFGNQTDGVATALSSNAGVSNDLVKKLLPMLAPIVLAYLAKSLTNKEGSTDNPLGGALGQILGGVLGGQSNPSAGNGVLGNILGGLLHGGR